MRWNDDGTVGRVGGGYVTIDFEKTGEWTFHVSELPKYRFELVERAPQWQDGDVVLDYEDGKDYRYYRLGGVWYTERGHRLGVYAPHSGCILVIRDGAPVA